MGKELLKDLLKCIRTKIEGEKEKNERKCTGPCVFPDCNEPYMEKSKSVVG